MPQLESRPPKDKSPRNGGDPNFNWRGLVLFAIAVALIGGAFLFKGPYGSPEEITLPTFMKLLSAGQIRTDHPLELVEQENSQTKYLRGNYAHKGPGGEDVVGTFRAPVDLEWSKNLP